MALFGLYDYIHCTLVFIYISEKKSKPHYCIHILNRGAAYIVCIDHIDDTKYSSTQISENLREAKIFCPGDNMNLGSNINFLS